MKSSKIPYLPFHKRHSRSDLCINLCKKFRRCFIIIIRLLGMLIGQTDLRLRFKVH